MKKNTIAILASPDNFIPPTSVQASKKPKKETTKNETAPPSDKM